MTKDEERKIRLQARIYARQFIAEKYYEEYRELYKAYIINRGVKPNKTAREVPLVDERELMKENLEQP